MNICWLTELVTHKFASFSIAYVECHSYDNAVTLKNWFDNKCVYLTEDVCRY